MSSKDQPTQSDIQPEGAAKVRPYTEEPEAEGHGARASENAGDAPQAESGWKRPVIEDVDTEGHELKATEDVSI